MWQEIGCDEYLAGLLRSDAPAHSVDNVVFTNAQVVGMDCGKLQRTFNVVLYSSWGDLPLIGQR